jgi:hypothetical protein
MEAKLQMAPEMLALNEFRETALILRNGVLAKMFDPRRDIDNECGYPDTINPEQYREMFDRNDIAARVVGIYPEECWAMDPFIYETEENDGDTEFEKAWIELNNQNFIVHHLQRADLLSGIGHYGVLLLGIDDGLDMSRPARGINLQTGQPTKTNRPQHKLLYIRTFEESQVRIAQFNSDVTSPRYGQPERYQIRVMDPRNEMTFGTGIDMRWLDVHWTRIVHVADNRLSSEVFGCPRMRPVWNRLCDIRKILGGSAEMFWKGGFPGYAFETMPEMGDALIDKKSIKAEFDSYQNGLQRFLALSGLTVKSLTPQVASPSDHFDIQLKTIAVCLGVPLRVFTGSEEAKLSSAQDALTWNKRLARRQDKYIIPMLIRPCLDRLIAFGILPQPAKLIIKWPDLNTSTNEEKARTAAQRTAALAAYVGGGVEAMVPPFEFMTHILDMPAEVANQIVDAAANHEATLETPEEKAAKLGGDNNAPKPAKPKVKKVQQKVAKKPPVKQ